MLIKKGNYTIISDQGESESERSGEGSEEGGSGGSGSGGSGSGEPGEEGSEEGRSGNPRFGENAKKMKDIPKVGEGNSNSVKNFRDFSRNLKNSAKKATEVTNKNPSRVYKGNLPKKDWGILTSQAMSRNNLSTKAKTLLNKLRTSEPLVNWKKELKKFFDYTFSSSEWVLPNKRFLSGGDMLYGRKNVGDDTLKTIVAAVDTSSSISNEQIKVFVNEIIYLTKTFDADKTIIIYCSDSIDNVDIIKKGGKPDFTKIASTGGNLNGFIPPFQWVEKNKIKPSIFVYLTDTGGDMPDSNKYGIKKYIKKVLWFVCSPEMYNPPPFGKILFAPVGAIKE